MPPSRRIVHILDDLAMGGVTRALKNFEHPILAQLGTHETLDIRTEKPRATSPQDIAVVHFTSNWKKFGWLLDLKLRGGFSRVILIEHTYTRGYETSEVKPKRRFRQMLKFAYALVDTVVAVSEAQRSWILQHALTKSEKVVAIPQSRTCDNLLTLPPCARGNGPLRIGAFGRFHKQKGFDLLVDAMARIPASVAQLKIAGTGPDETALRAKASILPHVEICDPFQSPEAFLADADAIAIPSRWEAFGLVGTEARAAGRPIIAAHVDGLDDQLDKSGFGHAPNSISGIVRAIYQAAGAKDLAKRGVSAQTKAAGEFDAMVGRWADLLSCSNMVSA